MERERADDVHVYEPEHGKKTGRDLNWKTLVIDELLLAGCCCCCFSDNWSLKERTASAAEVTQIFFKL